MRPTHHVPRPGTASDSDMTTWAMALGAAVLVLSAILWSGAALACLLTGRTPPTAGLLTALRALANLTDPASVWPHPSAMPGPVAYWTGTALAAAAWVGVTWGIWSVSRRVTTTESPRRVRRLDSLEGSVSWDVPVSTRASFVSGLCGWSPRCGRTIRASTRR